MKKFKNIQQFYNSQLFHQYFKRILLYFSIPCLLFSGILYSFYAFHNDYITREAFQSTVNYTLQSLNNTFDEIYKKYYLINSDKSVQYCMFINEKSFYLPGNRQFITNINNLLSYSIDTSKVIDSIYLYSSNNNYVCSVDKTLCVSSNHFDLFTDKTWFEVYNKKPQNQIIYGQYNDYYKSNVVSVVYKMQSNGVDTGLLVFNITENTLKNLLFTSNNTTNTNIMIKNEDYKVLSTFHDINAEKIALNAKQFEKIKDTIYYYDSLPFPDLTLYTSVSFPNNMSSLSLGLLLIFILFFAIVIPGFVAFALANSFYKSIANIVSYIQELDPQETDIENEMDFIQSRLKNVINLSKNFEQSIAKSIVETQQAQLISLQTQLNPHFLFNTLNALSLLNSTDSNKDDFELLIRNLSNLLSYCLNTTKSIVTISNEVEYSMYYVNMEEIKYNSKINVDFDIPKEIMAYSIPKFTFQPLLENCFKHGFKYIFDDSKKITVSAEIDKHVLTISFKDNGLGISQSDSDKINSVLTDGYFPQNQHIGIYNVNKRIQLIYGDEFGCRIYPDKESGTVVIIKIPLK